MEQKLKFTLIFPLLLISYEISVYMSNDMYLPAIPQLVHSLNTTTHLAQLTITSWFLGAASMQLLLGPVSDHFGRRPILLLGGSFFLLSIIVCATTHSVPIFLIARFIQGSTTSSVLVAGYACIHELFSHRQAIKTLAWMGSINVLAPAIGPLFGSMVLHFSTWRTIFWTLLVFAGILLALLSKFMPETSPYDKNRRMNIYHLSKNYIKILFTSNFIFNILIACFLYGGMIAWITTGPFLVSHQKPSNHFQFAFYQILIFGSYAIASQLVKILIHRWSAQKVINIGMSIVLFSGLLTLPSTLFFPKMMSLFIVLMMFFTFGAGLIYAPINRITVESSDKPMGAKIALMSTLMASIGVLASTMVIVSYNGTLWALAFIIGVLVCLASLARLMLYSINYATANKND